MPRFEREILGDVNPDVVALWQVLSHERYSAVLSKQLSSIPYEQSVFEEAKNETPVGLVEHAVRFLIQRRFSRGGLGTSLDYAS
jgi:ABC-type arginine/histidine transport system permease subunit